jgi:glycosyltransferase involved in cell wall biosynthesis
MNHLVSIIIPVYNSEKYVAAAISSALDQTWANKEIIIIDDGSTDSSLSIARSFESEIVKVFSQPNQGASAARNKGIKEAKGDYIQFLDADDLLSKNKIEEQLMQLLNNPGKIAVCSTVHFLNGQDIVKCVPSAYEDSFLYSTDDPPEFLSNLYGGNNNRSSMIQTNAWLTPTPVIKMAGDWSKFYSPDDDGDFFCRAVLASTGIIYVKDCFNYYRKFNQTSSLSSTKTKVALNGKFKSFLLKKKHLLNATNAPKAKQALAHMGINLAVNAYPIDKELTNKILKVVEELGGTEYVPPIGGKLIELIKRIMGWKFARSLQFYYSKIRKNR